MGIVSVHEGCGVGRASCVGIVSVHEGCGVGRASYDSLLDGVLYIQFR